MADDNASNPLGINNLDPTRLEDTTESGELERPALSRKIDCAGNSELADLKQMHSRGADRQGRR